MISPLAVNRSDGIIRNPAFPTATPFVTRDILHFWRKPGINILIRGGKHTILVSSLYIGALLNRRRSNGEGVWDSGFG